MSSSTVEILDISREVNFLTEYRSSLINLEHAIDHYLHVMRATGYTADIESNLSEFRRLIEISESIKLDEEKEDILEFARKNLVGFSLFIEDIIRNKTLSSEQEIEMINTWKRDYVSRMLADINKQWLKDSKKVEELTASAAMAKENGLWTLLVTAAFMLFVLIFTRFFMSGSVIQPIKIIENASNEIAAGSTAKRLTIKSSDEFGSLAESIYRMAEAIDDKIGKLKGSIAKEQAVVREQVILSELMAFIASGVELELLLTTFLGRTRDLLKAEHSAIFLLEKKAEKHDHVLKYFFNTFEQRTSLDCAEAMLNSVFRSALNTFIPLRTNRLMGEVPATHFTVKNLLAIPLSSADKKIAGLIVLVNKEGGFTPDDEEVLLNFSFQAFQAITMQQEVVHYATTDGLTGLNNHRVFIEQLNQEIERAARYSRDISLLMIDIDHFKSFNDIYGHQAGDRVLKNVAESIQKSIRATDFAARYGGEEFAVILPETIGEQALVVAERLRLNISAQELSLQNGESAFVTASIGFATYPLDADESDTLIRKADQGLYLAKESGRNRICRHSDTHGKPDGTLPDEVRHILKDTSLASIKELAKAIDAKSNYMRGHSFEVAALSVMTAREVGLKDEEIEGPRIASLLHDIGNLSIPDAILNKPGRLTDEEKKIIQGHSGLTEMLLRYYPMSESVLPAILYHHERFDGNGYPRGLKEEEIPVSAKILGVVEAYHAMVSPRPYKKRKTRLEAVAELEQEAGKQFDPLIIKTFVVLLLKVQDPVEKRKKPDA